MTRKLVIIAATLGLVAALVACTPRDDAAQSCLTGSAHYYDIPDNHATDRWPQSGVTPTLANGTGIDARSQAWDTGTATTATAIKLATVAGSRANLCFVGGSVRSDLDPVNEPWSTFHNPVNGVEIQTTGFHLIATRGYDVGDFVTFTSTATNWQLIGVQADDPANSLTDGASIHDDCVENDNMQAGLVSDSLFDGCHTFMSSRYGSSNTPPDGSANTVEISNTLIRLQDMHQSYKPDKYGFDHNGGWFKWPVGAGDGVPPHLNIHDSVFRAGKVPASYGNLELPAGTTCNNVTIVWLGGGTTFPGQSTWSGCTNLTVLSGTTGLNHWNSQVSSWLTNHPALTQ
ncbi:MAG: hypothetical protein ACXWBN_18365 [Acidimicrobiales bacterium]